LSSHNEIPCITKSFFQQGIKLKKSSLALPLQIWYLGLGDLKSASLNFSKEKAAKAWPFFTMFTLLFW